MGESRQELLQWLNSLLQLNITKVEQCGTGAALCQVYDSIFLDVPMSKVRFNVNSEYAYIQNFKILQNCFTKHQIERSIPIESLIKCKMQDNLEFLQWSKRYWDQYYPGMDYDPVSRRKGVGAGAAISTGPSSHAPPRMVTSTAAAAARRPGTGASGAATRGAGPRAGSAAGGAGSAMLMAQVRELTEMKNDLEKERDFYFNKLREIEILVQTEVDVHPESAVEGGIISQVQAILYSTEEGFEIPPEVVEEGGAEEAPGEEETF